MRDFGATPDGRKQHVEAFFRNFNWEHVTRQLALAEAAKQGADATGLREPAVAGAPDRVTLPTGRADRARVFRVGHRP